MQLPDNISSIAAIIQNDWKNIYFGAVPYLQAMRTLSTIQDTYGADSASSIINYFLSNARTWKGDTARDVKKKLNQLLQQKRQR